MEAIDEAAASWIAIRLPGEDSDDVPSRDQVLDCVAEVLRELADCHPDLSSDILALAAIAESKEKYSDMASKLEAYRGGPSWGFAIILVRHMLAIFLNSSFDDTIYIIINLN